MKRYTYLSLIALLLGVFVTSSCVDSLLNQDNPNGINKDDFFTNLDESESAINSLYSTMRNHWVVSARAESLRSDLAWPGRRSGNIVVSDVNYNQTFLNISNDLDKKWAAYYQGIFRANQVIEGLNKMKFEESTTDETILARWNKQMGEAKFFRGLFHFYAHSLFNNGDIIIRDTVPVRITDFDTPLSKSADVIEFFRKDLMFAYDNLPLPSEISESGRVTKGTAATILGTSFLYEQEYDSASVYFDRVINEYGYALETDMSKMFTDAGEFNSESIFEIAYSSEILPEANQWDEESMHNRWARGFAPWGTVGGTTDCVPAAWLAYEYTVDSINILDPRNKYEKDYSTIEPVAVAPVYRESSLRASALTVLATDFETPYYLDLNPVKQNVFKNLTPCFWKKYTNHDVTDSENTIMGVNWKSPCNVVMNRLSDVYLMKAECELLGNNNVTEALKLINAIRDRWGLLLLGTAADNPDYSETTHTFDNVAYDKISLMYHLMFKERPLELSAEGQSIRAIDMRRWEEVPELNYSTKKRFQDLTKENYHVVTYFFPEEIDSPTTNNPAATAKSRKECLIKKGSVFDTSDDTAVPLPQEFVNAAQFYNDSKAYLPIPLSEIQNNQAL
ncbi:RagB/SusD family nutrient uptake outer membrane protein [Saccharicrinis aurantiacus]|uniref:RagB/SusD family nutrient uptake outer membrane protein n=1 Tax=Saccharicrinis aurantiacus TaxID=1849719 RepID=UPI0024936CCC|nr:RagB/SusD family nutrient uptake outer membrane protein [Saccharicrinis aurantiacus]